MYCKYCGGRIASDATKCASCGAVIDLNDGGQSFFDDNELNEWQNESASFDAKTSVPKTEMRAPLPEDAFAEKNEKAFASLPSRATKRDTYSRRRHQKEKKTFGFLNLSGSNKLIIFCIASALAIVLLTVAIIAVLNSGKDETDSENVQTSSEEMRTSYSDTVNEESAADAANQAVTRNTADKDKKEIRGVKILINNQEISHPVSAYIIDGKIYVSIDRVLKAEGYKTGVKTDDNENRIRYDHTNTSKAIEIEKGTNKIWIRENDEEPETEYLDGENFNEGSDTYIAAKSFFNLLGYSKVAYDSSTMTLSVNK